VKTALVTGSARGIGRGVALALAEAGFSVAIHYRLSVDEAEKTRLEAQAFGVKAITFQADLTDSNQAEQLVLEAANQLGGLGVLINNVGNYKKGALTEMPLEEWHEMFDTNLHSSFYTCRAAIPIMRLQKFGRIINFGYAGASNLISRPRTTGYVIAKTGVTLMTKAIAATEIQHGITANVIAPGVIENSISQPITDIPAARLGRIDEVSSAVMYFLSDQAQYVTGQTLEVAGAWNL
jgi:3-oxoacyl-[acyl-carrier protein] reductase